MLNKKTLIAYGLPAFPLAALTLPVYIYVPTYYAQDLGLGLAGVGFMLLLARIWDVITDPIIGYASDRYENRIGRRKFWILLGAPFVIGFGWMLFNPPESATLIYLLLASLLLNTAWTMMILPLNALGAELSEDYDERSKIAGIREGLIVCGLLTSLSLTAIFKDQALFILGIFLSVLIPLTIIPFAAIIRERNNGERLCEEAKPTKQSTDHGLPRSHTLARNDGERKPQPAPKKIKFREGLQVLKNNRPFRLLIGAYLINGLANAFPATLFLLFAEFVLGMKDQAGPLLFVYFFCGMLGVPLWIYLSRRVNKHKIWCLAMVWACAFFLLAPFVGEGDYLLFLAVCILTGLSLGADLTLPASMQADVVDIDTLETGEQHTGLYFALWSMVTKLSLALAAGIAFPLLELFNFSAETGGNTLALVMLYAIVPIALKLIAIAIMWRYPLSQTDVENTRSQIREKWG